MPFKLTLLKASSRLGTSRCRSLCRHRMTRFQHDYRDWQIRNSRLPRGSAGDGGLGLGYVHTVTSTEPSYRVVDGAFRYQQPAPPSELKQAPILLDHSAGSVRVRSSPFHSLVGAKQGRGFIIFYCMVKYIGTYCPTPIFGLPTLLSASLPNASLPY